MVDITEEMILVFCHSLDRVENSEEREKSRNKKRKDERKTQRIIY